MGEPALRTGGRPRQIVVEDIVRVGRALGMRRLSLHAVAAELGVSTTALYRHVDGRWGLERLVGESLLSDVRLHDDPAHDTVKHLLSFGLQLRDFILDHPGFAGYLQTLFPRGAGGRRLLADEVTALGRRGYAPEAAIVLGSAVAGLAIGHAAAEELQADRADGIDAERRSAAARLSVDEFLGPAHHALPAVNSSEYVRLLLTGAIQGLVEAAPPGRPVEDVVAALHAAGEGV